LVKLQETAKSWSNFKRLPKVGQTSRDCQNNVITKP